MRIAWLYQSGRRYTACMRRALVTLLLCAGCAHAPPTPVARVAPESGAWEAVRGTIAPLGGDRYRGTSDAALDGWSMGEFEFRRTVASRLDVSVTVRRLTRDVDRPIEIHFLGGYFATNQGGSWYIWETDDHWTGWQRSGAIRADRNTLRVQQSGRRVVGIVNGVRVGDFELATEPPARGRVEVTFKGDPGTESQIELDAFRLDEQWDEDATSTLTASAGSDPCRGCSRARSAVAPSPAGRATRCTRWSLPRTGT